MCFCKILTYMKWLEAGEVSDLAKACKMGTL